MLRSAETQAFAQTPTAEEIRLIKEKFDAQFYKDTYFSADLNLSSEELFLHYLQNVRAWQLDPAPDFSERMYLSVNRDVAMAVQAGEYLSGFHHYVSFGSGEGRLPNENVIALPDVEPVETAAPSTDVERLLDRLDAMHGDGAAANAAEAAWAGFSDWRPDGAALPSDPAVEPIIVRIAEEAPVKIESVVPSFDAELQLVRQSGLFLADWYLATYPDLAAAEIDPLDHFYHHGFREGRWPNPYFDPLWYLEQNPDVQAAGLQPLLHYVVSGDEEGRAPVLYFDPTWYRQQLLPEDGADLALAHFLRHRETGSVQPNRHFEVAYYLKEYADVAGAKIDPFLHFLHYGYREGRNPSATFDTKYYLTKHLGGGLEQNPLIHYLSSGAVAGLPTEQPEDEMSIPMEVQRYSKPGPYFEEFAPDPRAAASDVKVIAYYLTQFHAFEQNDAWWGRGFTEWTNIARGLPRFAGHYQPRVPRDLGFYNLDDPDVMRRQAELARAAGVHGFCFYYYWFNGKRLMERPLERYLADPTIDINFCLMWANENWTRRWDGAESEVLIAQDYGAGDDEAMVLDFARHMMDQRYIRIGGRPLLMVYRPGIIPEAEDAIARWRGLFLRLANEDPIMVMAQCFNDNDPAKYGFDGAIEFPPHKVVGGAKVINHGLDYLDHGFKAQVYDYDGVVASSLNEPVPAFPVIKTAVPSWDNDARRQGKGLVITGSTPAKYEAWVRKLAEFSRRHKFHGESFVCINAWNEWAEGTYLEPDLHFGSAYLNATSRAICGVSPEGKRKVLLVGHDAFPSGAQHLLLNIGKLFAERFGVEIAYLLLGDGEMAEGYRAIGRLDIAKTPAELAQFVEARAADGFTHAVVNTTASAAAIPVLDAAGLQSILLVHELPRIMKEKGLVEGARLASRLAKALYFPTHFVAERFCATIDAMPSAELVIRPQGLYHDAHPGEQARSRTRAALGIAADERVVINAGYADLRKGYDLFLQLWRQAQSAAGRVHFIWCGNMDPGLESWLGAEIEIAQASGTFHHIRFTPSINDYYAAADVLALTSREDPFPSVVLEALSLGMPVAVFADSGGISEIVKPAIGRIVPYGDVPAMLKAVLELTSAPPTARQRLARRRLVDEEFHFPDYGWSLLEKVGAAEATVSVIVPNYNYARYLKERLGTIFEQTLPVLEVIVLDDASTDTSLEELERLRAEFGRDFRLVANEKNSGSVFDQWRRGLAAAKGDFVWIAEADDTSDRRFLERLAAFCRDPDVVMAFSDSAAIDPEGAEMWPSYKEYFATVEPGLLARNAILPAAEFLGTHLSVKNLILNVSSVLWRKSALEAAVAAASRDLGSLKMAGDWRIYAAACLLSDTHKVAYCAEPLNRHRRHPQSVTHALKAEKHLAEISQMHAVIADRLRLPEAGRLRQSRYIEELSRQFGLAPDEPLDPTQPVPPGTGGKAI